VNETVKCFWNGRGGLLEYGGRTWSREEIEAGIPVDVAKGLQSFRAPDFLVLWEPAQPKPADVVVAAAPEPPAKPKKPSKKGEE